MYEDTLLRDAILVGVAVVIFVLGVIYGTKEEIELRDKILSEGLKKYPQCAVAYDQIRCIEGLALAERTILTKSNGEMIE